MSTPLFKSMKSAGTSFFCFPSSAEKISASYQSENYKMYFTKYILLNFPKQNLSTGTNSNVIQWDFDNAFIQSNTGQIAYTYKDELVESLRNYVANMEETIRGSMLNSTDYYYDNTSLSTTSERIFWKWCKELNLMSFELATDGVQYFGNLSEFQSNNLNDTTYFPEVLWQERTTNPYSSTNISNAYIMATGAFNGYLQVEFNSLTNFRVNDKVNFQNVTNTLIINDILAQNGRPINGSNANVLNVSVDPSTGNQIIITDLVTTLSTGQTEQTGTVTLVYTKLVQYIAEVQGVNNVQEANRSYTEVYAHIPDQTGQTPDILFRTTIDTNYVPGYTFPILPSQYQPEIVGAELFNSPIVSNPQNYPGSYYGQFDTQDFTYTTEDGDSLRRSGSYYGISGDTTNPIVTGDIDGISLDFDPSHYVKMNIIDRELTSFEQFSALEVNNQPPSDFEFNAILWFYTVEDNNGNTAENAYGISFVDNPDNDPIPSETGLRVPTFKKLVATDAQDGTSYAFSLNLNFNIIADNPQDAYNPEAINSLFNFNLFNTAMTQLSNTNESFLDIIAQQTALQTSVSNINQLVYTQTDMNTINNRISNLENLLLLYQTMQIVNSDTVSVQTDTTTSPSTLKLNSIDPSYYQISNINTTDLYNQNGVLVLDLNVPTNKNFLVYVSNNDQTAFTLPNNDRLSILISRDLDYRQSLDIIIDATATASQNKGLDIYINYVYGTSSSATSSTPVTTLLIGGIDLPIYYNSDLQIPNSASNLSKFNFNIDFTKNISLNLGGVLQVPIVGSSSIILNSINVGDTLQLIDFLVGTSSVSDFSGQYTVTNNDGTYIYLDVSANQSLTSYNTNLPFIFNSILDNQPYFKLNKGIKYRITSINNSLTSSISQRYLIEQEIR